MYDKCVPLRTSLSVLVGFNIGSRDHSVEHANARSSFKETQAIRPNSFGSACIYLHHPKSPSVSAALLWLTKQKHIQSSTLPNVIQRSDTWHIFSIMFSKETWNPSRIKYVSAKPMREQRQRGFVGNDCSPGTAVHNLPKQISEMKRMTQYL